uniref:UDENN domain-containing protein n=1 Tax=Nannospalax galili TaxID=1026970 RepID=A0A8C6QHD2_NANGA
MGSRIKPNPETTFEVYVEVAYPRTGGTLSDPEVQRQFPEDYSDQKVRNMALDDVVILNVDTNTLETPFDDLQSLPNDVISSLKNRLKKVSTTTGDGVARAFLKAQ